MVSQKKSKSVVLVVGEGNALSTVTNLLKREKLVTETCSLIESRDSFKKNTYDLLIYILLDDQWESGLNRIAEVKQVNDDVPVFVITNNENWLPAVKLMKLGVREYLVLSELDDSLGDVVQHSIDLYHMTKKVYGQGSVLEKTTSFEGMVGVSDAMQENFKMISAVAKSNATVLITGESGTGKELVAKAIHMRSSRSKNRFVDLNCGAIPRDLLENELFGHEKGAFTGAHKRYHGSFEVAHKGTLFLDEISEMDPLLQVKLLRVLQERSFMRIGATEKIDVDVRIIAATNRNLQDQIERGQFREDLFYRLNVVNVMIPSLRERREDIPLLANHFLEYYSSKNNRIFLDFSNPAMEALINYDWPGNVRELENTIERIVVLHDDSQVKLKHLPKYVQKVSRAISFSEVARGNSEESRITPLIDLERQAIEMALLKFQGNISMIAKKLQIGQATLYRKIKKYGLQDYGKLSKGN